MITFGGKPLFPATVESPYIIRVAIALLMVACQRIEGQSDDPQRRSDPPRRILVFVENLAAIGADVEWA